MQWRVTAQRLPSEAFSSALRKTPLRQHVRVREGHDDLIAAGHIAAHVQDHAQGVRGATGPGNDVLGADAVLAGDEQRLRLRPVHQQRLQQVSGVHAPDAGQHDVGLRGNEIRNLQLDLVELRVGLQAALHDDRPGADEAAVQAHGRSPSASGSTSAGRLS